MGQKVANLEAELQEFKRLIAAGTPQESEVGEGLGENVRALLSSLTTSWLEGLGLMMTWDCRQSIGRSRSLTRGPGWC